MIIKKRGRFLYFYDLSKEEYAKLKYILTRQTMYNKEVTRKICMLFYDKDKKVNYTYFGYLDYIIEKFKGWNVVVEEEDILKDKILYIDEDKIKNLLNLEMRDYQVSAIKRALKRRYGTIVCSVGAGKTLIMAGLIKYLGKPALVICPDTQLVYQNKAKFIEYGINEDEIGLLCGDYKKLNKITIGTLMSVKTYIEKYPEKMKEFKVILGEEAHTTLQSTTGRFIDDFYNDSAEYIIGVTGTLYRYDNIEKSIEDFIMLGITGKPIIYIPLMYLVKKRYLSCPYVYLEPIKTYCYNFKSWSKVYKYAIESNKFRNKEIAKWITIADKENLTTLTLINTKKHAENIINNLSDDIKERTIIVFGNKRGMIWDCGRLKYIYIDYDKLMEEFKLPNSRYKHIIATQVFSTGTDLPTLNMLILAFVGKSFVQVMQRLGRVVRKHDSKDKVIIIDFFDDSHRYLRNQSVDRINIYKKEGIPLIHKRDKILNMIKDSGKKRREWIKKFVEYI